MVHRGSAVLLDTADCSSWQRARTTRDWIHAADSRLTGIDTRAPGTEGGLHADRARGRGTVEHASGYFGEV